MSESLDKKISEYVSSVESDSDILSQDITATMAHILMLYRTGLVPKKDAARIISALGGVESLEGDAEDGHELLESYITEKAGDSGGYTQTARSRNDQVAVATRLKLRQDTIKIQEGILDLVSILLERASQNTTTAMPLYTHLQRAQVGLLSHYLMAQADALIRDFGRFADMYGRLNANPLGAGPVGGSSLPVDRDITSELLAFPKLVENSLDATSSRDYMAEFVWCATAMMVNLSRMAEDIILWSSEEFGFVVLPDRIASPSSAMPHKKNPDVLELTRGKAARLIGDLTAVLAVQKGLASGYGRDLQETKEPAWHAAGEANGALQVMAQTVSGMEFNHDTMRQATGTGYITALDMAERLVQRGIAFRLAHMEVGALVGLAHSRGVQLISLSGDDIAKSCSIPPDIMAGVIAECTPDNSAAIRQSRGGAALNQQMPMIESRRNTLDELRRRLDSSRTECRKAEHILARQAEELSG